MIYLFSNEFGHDAASIGFPSVETCFAIVLQTDSMLLGWHTYNNIPSQLQTKAGVFNSYIGTVHGIGVPVRLYGATNRKEHGGDWKAELRSIAAALNYHGPATLVDLKQGEGTYVQFDRKANDRSCTVSYKRNSKVTYATQVVDVNATPHRRDYGGAVAPLYGGDDNTNKVYTGAQVDPNKSGSGTLHTSGWSNTTSFTIP